MHNDCFLTDPQQAVLDLIASFIAANGWPPTRAEISRHMGWSSSNAAGEVLKALDRKGRIQITRGISRGIKIL